MHPNTGYRRIAHATGGTAYIAHDPTIMIRGECFPRTILGVCFWHYVKLILTNSKARIAGESLHRNFIRLRDCSSDELAQSKMADIYRFERSERCCELLDGKLSALERFLL